MKKWNSLEELAEWETGIIEDYINHDDLNFKSLLLCFGVGDSKLVRELAKIVNPSRERRTGNTGIPLRLSNGSIINTISSVVYEEVPNQYFTAASPLRLEGDIDNVEIIYKGKVLDKAEFIKPKPWINLKTKNGKPYSSIFLSESGSFLMGTLPVICYYQAIDKPCLFCEYNQTDLDKKVEDFVEVAAAAFSADSCYRLTMTGGNTNTEDRGIKQYGKYVKNISEAVSKIIGKKPSIQLELSPPDFSSGNGEKYIDEAVEAGATSFMMNLEQGDDKYRKVICAEKGKIPFSDYINAYEYITKEKGLGAASLLINGLMEPPESTMHSAKKLLELGVKPIIQPFRPFSKLNRVYPSNPYEFERLSNETARLIKDSNLDLYKLEGCANCPGCAILEQDIV